MRAFPLDWDEPIALGFSPLLPGVIDHAKELVHTEIVLPDAERSLNVEFAREEEFSPVKNAEGNDSPATTRRDMVAKFARWFDACGVAVPRDADGAPMVQIEIDPCYALNADDLKAKLPPDFKIEGDVLLKE